MRGQKKKEKAADGRWVVRDSTAVRANNVLMSEYLLEVEADVP